LNNNRGNNGGIDLGVWWQHTVVPANNPRGESRPVLVTARGARKHE
jgi:hypothetical protein